MNEDTASAPVEVSVIASRFSLLSVETAVLVLAFAGAAFAADANSNKALNPDGKDACFARVYDDAHMQSHPNQKIERIFFISGHNPMLRANEMPPSDQASDYTGYLASTMRGAKKPDWAGAVCGAEEEGNGTKIRCGMDCDRTMGELKVDGKGNLILSGLAPDLYLDAGSEDELGEAEYKKQSFGSDDDNFHLDRKPMDICLAEFNKIDPVDTKKGPPLRERLKPDQPFCYGRDYDADHMKTHPAQLTTTLRIYRGPKEIADNPEGMTPESWPDQAHIMLAVTTLQGSGKTEMPYRCVGSADQWDCTPIDDSGKFDCQVIVGDIYLRRGANGTMMLANPNTSMPIVDLCTDATGKEATKSDDKVFRLSPMPNSACGL